MRAMNDSRVVCFNGHILLMSIKTRHARAGKARPGGEWTTVLKNSSQTLS